MAYTPIDAWKQLYLIDFTAQGTQNLIAGGSFTIDSRSWTVENQGNASAFTLTNGTGLVISPNSGAATYKNNTRTAPLIRADLGSFITNFSMVQSRAIRVMARVTTNAATDNQFMRVGFEFNNSTSPSTVVPQQFHMLAGRGRSGGANVIGNEMATGTTDTVDTNVTSSDDVLCCVWRPHWNADFRSATFGTTFPADGGTFRSSMMSTIGAPNTLQVTSSSSTQMRVVLTAYPDGAGSGFTATFTHFAIYQLI